VARRVQRVVLLHRSSDWFPSVPLCSASRHSVWESVSSFRNRPSRHHDLALQPQDIVDRLTTRFDGLAPKASWGETSLFYNPNLALTNGVYFCTVKDHDGANDKASALDREGVFRLAVGLTVRSYERLFGPRPARPPKGSAVVTGHDFTRLDVVMPHPVYAWMGWVQVLNPSEETFASMQPLFAESYDHVVRKFEKSLAKHRRSSQ